MSGDPASVPSLRHELRTPLSAIIGYAAMLREDLTAEGPEAPAELARQLDRILRAGEELLGRVDAVTGRTTPVPATGDPLRTPLRAILEAAGAIAADPHLDPGVAEDVGRIRTAGAALLSLVDGLPRAAGDDPRTAPPAPQPPPVREDEPATVLVVDDNPTNRDILDRRLRRLGHRVVLAEDGRSGLAAMRSGVDLVLLDVVMPGMDGYAVLAEVRADPELRGVPVLVLSALDDGEAIARCLRAGAADFLPKPFDPVVLRARVCACLENKRLRDGEARNLAEVEAERRRADALLHTLLPDAIAAELTATEAVAPRRHEDVAVLFADVAGFTRYCDQRAPEEVLANLQDLVERFEECALRHGLQKIKTIGDAFLGVAGAPTPVADPVLVAARCGLEMVEEARRLERVYWRVRVGIHVGPVIAGVLGRRHYGYDVWGDTVNTAERVERFGVVDAVVLSAAAWSRIAARGEAVPVVGGPGPAAYRLLAVRD